jgi:hypothetical protein
MIGQYLPNNNENATVAFCQKFRHPNGALVAAQSFYEECQQLRHRLDAKNFAKNFRFPVTSNL